MNRDEVFRRMCGRIAQVVDADADSIREDQRLVGDLGADSLDFLDLTFHLQQEFGIVMSPRSLGQRTRAQLGDTPAEVDGVYSPEALVLLRQEMPEVPPEELHEGLTPAELPRSVRVGTLVNLIMRLQEEKNA